MSTGAAFAVDGRSAVESTVHQKSTVHHERRTCAEKPLANNDFERQLHNRGGRSMANHRPCAQKRLPATTLCATVTHSWWTVDLPDKLLLLLLPLLLLLLLPLLLLLLLLLLPLPAIFWISEALCFFLPRL